VDSSIVAPAAAAPAEVSRYTEDFLYASMGELPLRIWVQYETFGPRAYLVYQVFDWETLTTHEGGMGEAPPGLLRGIQGGHARFEVNTADLPGFTVYAGSGGLISLKLEKNGEQSLVENNQGVNTYPDGTTSRWSSHKVLHSVDVSGTVVGWTGPSSTGVMDRFRDHTVKP
jgi:hypothetical protein